MNFISSIICGAVFLSPFVEFVNIIKNASSLNVTCLYLFVQKHNRTCTSYGFKVPLL